MKQQEIADKTATQSSKRSQNGTTDDGQLDKESFLCEPHFPFVLLKNDKTNGKIILIIANYRLPFEFETEEEAHDFIEARPWNLLIEVISVLMDASLKERGTKK